MGNALDDYFSSLVESARSVIGAPVDGGTVVVPQHDRVGTGSATSYPTPSGTIVGCDPALVESITDMLAGLADRAIDSVQFVHLATSHGATLSGFDNNRVLVGELVRPPQPAVAVEARVLDRGRREDVATLATFVAASTADDLEEADIDLDELDPLIVGLFDADEMVAYGSGRPYDDIEAFDDIGVLTMPSHRRRGLGASVVAEFVERRLGADPTRRMLYRCTTENAGSNAIAASLGFTLAHTIGAVQFA